MDKKKENSYSAHDDHYDGVAENLKSHVER